MIDAASIFYFSFFGAALLLSVMGVWFTAVIPGLDRWDSDGDWVPDTNEGIVNGYYHESEYISAPSFSLRIDGITELN